MLFLQLAHLMCLLQNLPSVLLLLLFYANINRNHALNLNGGKRPVVSTLLEMYTNIPVSHSVHIQRFAALHVLHHF